MKIKDFLSGIPYAGWVVIYTALCWGMFAAILGVVTPELKKELGNFQDMGLLMATWAAGSVVGAIQGGRLAGKFSARPLFISYMSFTALAILVIVVAEHFWLTAFGFFMASFFEAALLTLGHGILALVYKDPVARARTLSLVDVAYSSGHFLTPTIVIAVLQFNSDWRFPYQLFFIPLGIALLSFLPKKYFTQQATGLNSEPNTSNDSAILPSANTNESSKQTSIETSHSSSAGSYKALVSQKSVRWIMACGFMAATLEWAPVFWSVTFGIEVLGISANQSRLALQFFVAGMVVARIWQAFSHSELSLERKMQVLSSVTVLGIVPTLLLPLLPTIWPSISLLVVTQLFWAFNALYGVGVGVFFPVLLAWLIDRNQNMASKASAVLMISFTLGCQFAGFVIGALSDRIGLNWAYGLIGIVAVCLFFSVLQLKKFPIHTSTSSTGALPTP
jgi:MFS family permease